MAENWDMVQHVKEMLYAGNLDKSEQHCAEELLHYFIYAVEQSPSTVIITDVKGNIEYVNPKFSQTSGYSREEAIGQNPRVLKSGAQPPELYKKLWETICTGGEWHGEFHNKKKSGELYWEAASISPIRNTNGEITRFLAVKEDITARKEAEAAVQKAEAILRNKLMLAGNIQKSFLPQDVCLEKLAVESIFEPYYYVSGDGFDFKWRETDGKLLGYLVDVMGNGLATALQTSAVRVIAQQVFEHPLSLKKKIKLFNRQVAPCFTEDSFAGLIAFEFDFQKNILTYVSAGINYFIVRRNNCTKILKVPGSFLGILPEMEYEQHTLLFEQGDSFFFLTDGLFEQIASEEFTKIEGHNEAVSYLKSVAKSDIRFDDATAVCIKIK